MSISSAGTVHDGQSPKDLEDDNQLRSLSAFDYNFSKAVDDRNEASYDARFQCDCEDCTPPSSSTSPDTLSEADEDEDQGETDESGREEEDAHRVRSGVQSRSSSGSSSMSTSLLAEAAVGTSKDCLQLPLLDDELDLSNSANHAHLPRRRRGSSIKELLQTNPIEYFDY